MTQSYNSICIVDTTYSLLLYLLKMDLKEIQSTMFFVGDTIHQDIRESLPNGIYLPTNHRDWITKIRFRFKRYVLWHGFSKVHIYAQDHIEHADILIGNNDYTLIEDAPKSYTQVLKSPCKPFVPNKGDSLKRRIKYFLSHSSIYGKTFGTNEHCINRWVTEKSDFQSILIDKHVHEYVDIKNRWETISAQHRNYILSVFGLSNQDFHLYNQADMFILTQPLMEDCKLSENEMIDIYSPYIIGYNNVVIKPHPRDKFDYTKHFPKATIMSTTAPIQLLNLNGFSPSIAMTAFSTALSAMPMTTRKIFLGTRCNSKLLELFGDIAPYDSRDEE